MKRKETPKLANNSIKNSFISDSKGSSLFISSKCFLLKLFYFHLEVEKFFFSKNRYKRCIDHYMIYFIFYNNKFVRKIKSVYS